MDTWFPIETARLRLREFSPADEPAIHAYASDPLVSRYDVWGPNDSKQTRDVLSRWIDEQQLWPRDEVTLGIELKAESELVGSIRLKNLDHANRAAEIGYCFARKYWNHGYATEAARGLVDRAFAALRLHRVCASCDTRNTASWRVMEKIGMRREAHFVRDVFQKGEWRDSYLYALLSEERPATQSS